MGCVLLMLLVFCSLGYAAIFSALPLLPLNEAVELYKSGTTQILVVRVPKGEPTILEYFHDLDTCAYRRRDYVKGALATGQAAPALSCEPILPWWARFYYDGQLRRHTQRRQG
jgi:hypothetical protein